jgi:predicted nucleic acid-binding protein
VTTTETSVYVVDASVSVKWFAEEEDSLLARSVIRPGVVLLAPELLFPEAASALTKKVRAGEFPQGGLSAALDELDYLLEIVPSRSLMLAAQALSFEFGTSFYDCIYLALAQREGARLLTADERFRNGMGRRFSWEIQMVAELPV